MVCAPAGAAAAAEERELLRLRRRETAIVLVATAIPYATAIVVLVVVASIFVSRNAAALGGTAFVGVLVGFAAQRFLMDIVAGAEIWGKNWADAPARLQEDLQEFGRLAAAGRTWAEARDLLVETATSKDGHVCQDGECSRTSARTRS